MALRSSPKELGPFRGVCAAQIKVTGKLSDRGRAMTQVADSSASNNASEPASAGPAPSPAELAPFGAVANANTRSEAGDGAESGRPEVDANADDNARKPTKERWIPSR